MASLRYRLLKAGDTIAYLGLIWLSWRFLDGELHWKLAIGAVVLSGAWLALTSARMNRLFTTYFDVLSRLEVALPAALGTGLSLLALVHTSHLATRVVAVVELAGWGVLLLLYRRNRHRFSRQGHGPVPAGCWVSPPAGVLQPGDLILTSGLVAAGLRESVGHGETVLRLRDRDTDLETLVLTIPGVVAANGLNSRGVGLCVNAVTQLAYAKDGLPVAFVIRGVLKKDSFQEAAEFLRTIKPAAPQNYLLGGPNEVASLELSRNRIAAFVPFEGAALTYHTNQPLVNGEFNPRFLERLKVRGWSLDRMKASCPRFNFLKKMLGDNSAALGLDDLKALYRDRESGVNNAGTYACTIILLGDDPELHIAPGRPDTEPFQVLAFSGRPAPPR